MLSYKKKIKTDLMIRYKTISKERKLSSELIEINIFRTVFNPNHLNRMDRKFHLHKEYLS